MKRKLFTAVCILLASAMLPCGAFAKAKKDAKKDIGIQLYSVRDLIGSFGRNQHDYKPVLKALADMVTPASRPPVTTTVNSTATPPRSSGATWRP